MWLHRSTENSTGRTLRALGITRRLRHTSRIKTCGRALAGELARRYAGTISSVAFDPAFIIDKSDPELRKRWPSGLSGLFWSVMAALFARPPAVAGEPIADLMLLSRDRSTINGAMFKLDKRVDGPRGRPGEAEEILAGT